MNLVSTTMEVYFDPQHAANPTFPQKIKILSHCCFICNIQRSINNISLNYLLYCTEHKSLYIIICKYCINNITVYGNKTMHWLFGYRLNDLQMLNI